VGNLFFFVMLQMLYAVNVSWKEHVLQLFYQSGWLPPGQQMAVPFGRDTKLLSSESSNGSGTATAG
jgi:hypothetical protein